MNLALRTSAWLILGTWTGAWVLFALVIAPTALRVLPGSQAAGQLIGPVLESLHLYGIAAGVALAGLSLLLRRGALHSDDASAGGLRSGERGRRHRLRAGRRAMRRRPRGHGHGRVPRIRAV